MVTSRSGSGKASGRRSTPLTTLNTATFPPMPSANVSTAASVKPGVLRSWRNPKRRSNAARSIPRTPRPSRIASLCCSTLPNASDARRRASLSVRPRRACLAASMSRWKRISSSSSDSMVGRDTSARSHMAIRFVPRMPTSSLRGAQELLDRDHQSPPALGFDAEGFAAEGRQVVVLGAAIVVRDAPFAVDPLLLLETLEGGIERALVDLEHAARRLLDALGDAPAVHRRERERAQNEEVDRAAERLAGRFTHRWSSRRPKRGIKDLRFRQKKVSPRFCRSQEELVP